MLEAAPSVLLRMLPAEKKMAGGGSWEERGGETGRKGLQTSLSPTF